MATKVKTGVIDSSAITSALIANASITADDLHTTLDLTGKTVTVSTASAGDNDTSVASTAYVDVAIANLADSAPSTLNTLNELAAALGDDANYATTTTAAIAGKLPLAGGTMTGALTTTEVNIGAGATNGSKLRVNGKIVAGDSSSTGGDVLLEGYYGNGATSVIGSEYSSGGLFLGYGVHPSTTTQGQFLSSSVANLSQGAYVVSDTHKWYTVTGGSSVAVGSQLTTMTERMRIKSDGYVGIGTDNPLGKFVVSNAGAEGIEFFPGSSSNQNTTQHYNRSGSAYVKNRTIALNHEWVNGGTDPAMNLIPDGNSTFLVIKAKSGTFLSTANLSLYGTNPNANGGSVVSRATVQAVSDGTAFGTKMHLLTNNTSNVETRGITIDAAQNVGIGTQAPGALLDLETPGNTVDGTYYSSMTINNTGSSTYSGIRFDRSAVAKWRVGIMPDDKFQISKLYNTVADDTFVIDSSGKVGIGTTGPNEGIHISKSGDASIRLQRTSVDQQLRIDQNSIRTTSNSDISIFTNGNASQLFLDQSSGNVGIGTSSPEVALHIDGPLLISADNSAGISHSYTGASAAGAGKLIFNLCAVGTLSTGDTIVFTYNALNWKSWFFKIRWSSTGGYMGERWAGGYNNNSSGYQVTNPKYGFTNAGQSSGDGATLTVTRSGQANTFTLTLDNTHVHPMFEIEYACGGGEGYPKASRASISINS